MKDKTEIIEDTLKHSFVFRNASKESFEKLLKGADVVDVKKGEVLFAEGDTSQYLFVLVSGRMAFLMHDQNNKRYTLGLIGDHSIFGDMELFTKNLRVSHAEALVDSRVLRINKDLFIEIAKNDAAVSYRIVEFYAALLERLSRYSLFRDVEKQLAYILVDLAKRYRKQVRLNLELARPTQAIEIDVPLSQEFLGTMVGIPRQRVNVILKSWEAKGLIKVSYNKLIVLDEIALKKFSVI